MKKYTLSLIAVLMLLVFYPVKASAETNDNTEKEAAVEATAREQADVMTDRLYEILDMNIKSLDGPTKEKLRNEVMTIKDKLQMLNGIYISAGALIIIILLLLLL